MEMRIDYTIDWTDHRLLHLKLEVAGLVRVNSLSEKINRPSMWKPRSVEDVRRYQEVAHALFCNVCPIDMNLSPEDGKNEINRLYNDIVSNMKAAAERVFIRRESVRRLVVPGWNDYVKSKYDESRQAFLRWIKAGRPKSGLVWEERNKTKQIFKKALTDCQNMEEQMKMDAMARDIENKNFVAFWSKTSTATRSRNIVPTHVDGKTKDVDIANIFCSNFMDTVPLIAEETKKDIQFIEDNDIEITIDEIKLALKRMGAGKSPGHDTLTLEHIKNAGWIVPLLLANLFTAMIKWNYLPIQFTKTIVVPILKSRQLDASDSSNYRPISLAAVCARVFEKVLLLKYSKKLKVSDSQVGFKTGGSTDIGIFTLKHVVSHYIRRDTSIYVCYLDLSKAFDRVVHTKLWQKLRARQLPDRIVDILAKWHKEQENVVRWNNVISKPAPLRCGVRQGGSASPVFFNVYMDELSQQLKDTAVGCHIAGVCTNHIAYADDMVLLAPTVSALRRLLLVCEKYAQSHGLIYNVKKTKAMMFKSKSAAKSTPLPITMAGQNLEWVDEFKYLGHIVTSNLSDSLDIDRQRRALSVRSNMLARRFSRCSEEVKTLLFRTYCTNMYTCELWTNHTKVEYNALRVQYNNALRIIMRLPKFCSASNMFTERRLPGFAALIRQRSANTRERFYRLDNSVLATILQVHGPILKRWNELHERSIFM